ncbi:MAG: PIN domain-containing protein [Treponema sp.]|nr:PIN domain-containing protein [Treponema sp.]
MTKYALDTNIISYYLKGNTKLIDRINDAVKNGDIIIPPIVYFEIKKWLLKNQSKVKLAAFEVLLAKYGVDEISKKTLDISLSIYLDLQSRRITVDDADIFIAGYCIENDYILITNNTKHFENIKDLRIENWVNPGKNLG